VVEAPAEYVVVSEKVIEKPAYTTWKKGRGEIEKVDNATGEIMCLVKVPAEYKIVEKKIFKTAATTKKVIVPAKYETVKKKVVDTPAHTKKVVIPAKYKTVDVKVEDIPAKTEKIDIAAEYKTVTKKLKISEPKIVWKNILCETNTTEDVIRKLQRELIKRGYKAKYIDGYYGKLTKAAVNKYQKDNNLASGALTIDTLKSLGVVE
jgi:hypothetical protein